MRYLWTSVLLLLGTVVMASVNDYINALCLRTWSEMCMRTIGPLQPVWDQVAIACDVRIDRREIKISAIDARSKVCLLETNLIQMGVIVTVAFEIRSHSTHARHAGAGGAPPPFPP